MSRDRSVLVTGKQLINASNLDAIGRLRRLRSPSNMIEAVFAACEEHLTLTN